MPLKRTLPPLNALKVFEAAARHLSFSKAAQELCLTHGAISKQIKILEEYFNKQLFNRLGRGLQLTAAAQDYYNNISSALDSIDSSSKLLNDFKIVQANNIIVVNIFASFGTYWLIPRIQDFKDKNPDIHLYITTGYGSEVKIEESDCDVIIWGYKHSFKKYKSEKLLDEELSLVCSKSLIPKKIKTINELINYPFLKNNYRDEIIPNWTKSVKINKNLIKTNYSFDYLYMLIEGAKQGLGLAFIPTFLVRDLLKKGDLINPLNIKYKTDFAFHIVYPKNGDKTEKVKKFSEWLIKELRKNK